MSNKNPCKLLSWGLVVLFFLCRGGITISWPILHLVNGTYGSSQSSRVNWLVCSVWWHLNKPAPPLYFLDKLLASVGRWVEVIRLTLERKTQHWRTTMMNIRWVKVIQLTLERETQHWRTTMMNIRWVKVIRLTLERETQHWRKTMMNRQCWRNKYKELMDPQRG